MAKTQVASGQRKLFIHLEVIETAVGAVLADMAGRKGVTIAGYEVNQQSAPNKRLPPGELSRIVLGAIHKAGKDGIKLSDIQLPSGSNAHVQIKALIDGKSVKRIGRGRYAPTQLLLTHKK